MSILSIVDATNLDRHLYLTSQLIDLGEPVVVAVNMIDAAEAQGIKIDFARIAANGSACRWCRSRRTGHRHRVS